MRQILSLKNQAFILAGKLYITLSFSQLVKN